MVDVNLAIDKLMGASGDIPLAVDRYVKATGERLTEYDLLESITSADETTTNTMMRRYRLLMAVKLFSLISELEMDLRSAMQDLRPSELAKAHSSLVNTFSTLTSASTKITFDFETEVTKLANEMELPVDDVMHDVKAMMAKLK